MVPTGDPDGPGPSTDETAATAPGGATAGDVMVPEGATAGDAAVPDGVSAPARTRPWRRLATDAAVLVGLAGLAVTQPVLDLFGRNPTFFVAGNYGRRRTVLFALVVALVPATVVWLATTLAGLAGRRARVVAHGVGVALFAGLFGLVVCRTLGVDAEAVALVLAAALGAAVAIAEARLATVRRYLSWLAAGNLVFLALFLVGSPTSELLTGAVVADAGAVRIPPLDGPVTVVVLDEFPLAAVLRPDGTINEVRYPNLAALAGESTWFRNASTEWPSTALSVPEILSGTRSDEDDLPFLADHPRNLFTLFGGAYPVSSYEPVTDLCPPDRCSRPEPSPLGQALSDAWVVYRHRVLPGSLRSSLPAVDHGWGDFGDAVGEAPPAPSTPPPTTSSGQPDRMARLDELPESDGGRIGQAGVLRREMLRLGSEPSVNLIHVLLPHHPYDLTPWGVSSTNRWVPATMPDPGEPDHERAFAELYAMQAMQVAAVDQMLGELVAHLRATGAWDTGTFVLVSDHGIDITPPRFSRTVNDENEDGVLRIPLFVRAPGLTPGEVRDEPATTLDVLPSLIDILGIEADWELDGHSLFDGSEPGYERALSTGTFEEGLGYVARQQAHLGPGDGWTSVLAIGENGDLVGTAVADHRVGTPSRLSWRYDQAAELADPAAAGGMAPVQLRGTVAGSDEPPPDLVVALDGVISGTIGGYLPHDDGWAFTGVLGPEIAGGAAEVTAYEVERRGRKTTLHPLVP